MAKRKINWWDEEAAALQASVVAHPVSPETHSADDVRRSVIHTREDVVLLVGYLSALNRQVAHIRAMIAAMWLVAIIALVKHVLF